MKYKLLLILNWIVMFVLTNSLFLFCKIDDDKNGILSKECFICDELNKPTNYLQIFLKARNMIPFDFVCPQNIEKNSVDSIINYITKKYSLISYEFEVDSENLIIKGIKLEFFLNDKYLNSLYICFEGNDSLKSCCEYSGERVIENSVNLDARKKNYEIIKNLKTSKLYQFKEKIRKFHYLNPEDMDRLNNLIKEYKKKVKH